jgi:alpha-beta hydrolase superfamily lysophospholipase
VSVALQVISYQGSELLWLSARTPDNKKQLVKVLGAYHDILNDPDQHLVHQAVVTFIKQHGP